MRRAVPLLIAAVLAVALAGCATASRPDAETGDGWKFYGIQGGGTPAPDDPPDEPVAEISDGVVYDEALPASARIEWADSMFADADFTVDSPDDGDGRWSYQQVSTGCRVSFWQTAADGIGAPGDERTRSDEMLAVYLDFDLDEVQEYVFDTSVSLALAGGATFDARAVVGSGDTDDWITLARVFDGPDVGLALDLTCPAGTDAETALTALMPDFVAAFVS